jgi:hypothetical protein
LRALAADLVAGQYQCDVTHTQKGPNDAEAAIARRDLWIDVTDSRQEPEKGPCQPREAVEGWFVDRGVPRFVEDYSIRHRLSALVAPLSVVAASQIVAAALLSLKTWQVAIAPALVVALALPILPVVRAGLDPRSRETRRDQTEPVATRPLLRLVPLAAAAVGAAFLLPADDPQWDLCVDGLVMLSALLAAGMLMREEIWTFNKGSMGPMRFTLFALVVSAVLVFALEGSPIRPFETKTLGALPASAPQALPALPILALALLLAWALSRRALEPTHVSLDGGVRGRNLLGLSPILVVVLGFETAVLPGTVSAALSAIAPVVVLAVLVVLVAWSLRFGGRSPDCPAQQIRTSTSRVRPWLRLRGVSREGLLALVIPAYVLAYPIVAQLSGQETFLVSLAINFAYLVVAWFVVFYGLDRVAVWTIGKLGTDKKELVLGLVRGLPLLLVFSALFIMTTELWQAAVGMDNLEYYGLLAALAGLIALFVLMSSVRELVRHCRFRGWEDVSRAARRIKPPDDNIAELEDTLRRVLVETGLATPAGHEQPAPADDQLDPGIVTLLDETGLVDEDGHGKRDPKPELKLSRSQKVNALAVVLVYQALIFAPVFAAVFVVFFLAGRATVSDDLLKNWIYGDNARPEDHASFHALPFFTEPWTRMAFFLAVFSLLYFAVSVLSSEQLRREFFAAADEGIRQRLAVRLLYQVRLPCWAPDPPAQTTSKTRSLVTLANPRARARALRSP